MIYERLTNELPYDAIVWEMKGPYAGHDELVSEIQGKIQGTEVDDDGKTLMTGLLQPTSKDRTWDVLESSKWLVLQ